jgi:hypothetical protein
LPVGVLVRQAPGGGWEEIHPSPLAHLVFHEASCFVFPEASCFIFHEASQAN